MPTTPDALIHGTSPLLVLSVVLTAGVACGTLAKRFRLPSVTGQILIGILLGPSVLNLFEHDAVEGLHPVTHFALGLIAVTVGSHLNLFKLRNAGRRLIALVALGPTRTRAWESLAGGAPAGGWRPASRPPARAVPPAPATVIAIVKECRAKGVFVKTLMAAVAFNNVACLALFEIAYEAARVALGSSGSFSDIALAPIRQIGIACVLGVAIGLGTILFTRKVVRRERLATASIIAILLTTGLADWLNASSLLSCLILGATLANVPPNRDELGHRVFSDFESAIFAIFFTLAGMELDLKYVVQGGGFVALAVVGARLSGKLGSAWLAMKLTNATERVRQNLGFALVPQAGVAVGLLFLVREAPSLSSLHEPMLAIGLTVVTLNEIIGPILARIAISRSGDFGKDRARLIDFLHEENIVVNLEAETKEDAIQQLTQVLIQSNHLHEDRERLLDSILTREREISTCVGGGLAVPHGVLTEGEKIVGAMGISMKGLPFETPDGIPVHCMVVLGTPPSKRTHHLKVLAALARAVGSDPNVQKLLYSAKTSAHAYDILHAEESEDFNYFLED